MTRTQNIIIQLYRTTCHVHRLIGRRSKLSEVCIFHVRLGSARPDANRQAPPANWTIPANRPTGQLHDKQPTANLTTATRHPPTAQSANRQLANQPEVSDFNDKTSFKQIRFWRIVESTIRQPKPTDGANRWKTQGNLKANRSRPKPTDEPFGK